MIRLVGLLFVLLGASLLYLGWQAQDAVPTNGPLTPDISSSIWYLAAGAVAAVWGLCAMLRRAA